MIPFQDLLREQRLLMDGAMGTYLYQKGVFIDKCYDALNLHTPELVASVHRDYIAAGAQIIETNTFGANRFKLKKHNLSDQVVRINREGAKIAAKVAGGNVYVAGAIGPLGVELAPFGEAAFDEAKHAFSEQTLALAEGGVDLFVLETFQNPKELELAVLAVRSVSDLPIIAQIAVLEDGKTAYGFSVEEGIALIDRLPVDAVGINCMVGPKAMLDFLEKAVRIATKPFSVLPNAGRPQSLDGRTFYLSTPEYFGVYAKRFIEAGARLVGGCCGTTPDHIRKMADAIAQQETRIRIAVFSPRPREEETVVALPPIPIHERSNLGRALSRGEFVRLVEMVPPRGLDLEKHLSGACLLKERGVQAINIPDGPRASARMNGLALAVKIQQEVGIETVLHYTCRDRNLLGMQSDLLGAAMLGICNILAITGDPPMMGDYPTATAVFDIDSIGLTRLLFHLNQGMDVGGRPIGQRTRFVIGVGVDPNSINPEREAARFRQKREAGAEFAISQPVFDLEVLESFLDRIRVDTCPLIAGIWPLVSLRNAEFMKHEVPGVCVPDAILERIGRYTSKADQLKAGIAIAQEMAAKVRTLVQGIQVSAPFGRYPVALEVLEAVSP